MKNFVQASLGILRKSVIEYFRPAIWIYKKLKRRTA